MQASFIFLNKHENFTMNHSYHTFCDPDFGLGYCVIIFIPYHCYGCVKQLSHKWLPIFQIRNNLGIQLKIINVIIIQHLMYTTNYIYIYMN